MIEQREQHAQGYGTPFPTRAQDRPLPPLEIRSCWPSRRGSRTSYVGFSLGRPLRCREPQRDEMGVTCKFRATPFSCAFSSERTIDSNIGRCTKLSFSKRGKCTLPGRVC